MPFTDEDLKRLKETLALFRDILETGSTDFRASELRELFDFVEATLARLEAAEQCAERLPDCIEASHDEYCGVWAEPEEEEKFHCSCGPDKALVEAWRKAAGK